MSGAVALAIVRPYDTWIVVLLPGMVSQTWYQVLSVSYFDLLVREGYCNRRRNHRATPRVSDRRHGGAGARSQPDTRRVERQSQNGNLEDPSILRNILSSARTLFFPANKRKPFQQNVSVRT